jgi:DNA polymerase (family X)
MLDNRSIADLLRRVAAVYQVSDESIFRYRAYENAATAIESLDIPLETLWQKQRLKEVAGLGPNLISHLDELFQTGKVKHFQSEFKKVPSGMFSLLSIRGLGPKTAFKIAHKFHLNNESTAIDELKNLIKANKLLEIEGFREALQEKIRTSLIASKSDSGRLLLIDALAIADDLQSYLRRSKLITNSEPLGSLRRRLDTVGDIDIGFCSDKPKEAMKYALKYPEIKSVISAGDSVARIELKSNHFVDIKTVETKNWGSLLQHYTGSKLHNIALRNLAKSKNLSLSEYGIKSSSGKIMTFSDENTFYSHLGLAYIPPELREDQGEIDKAKNNQLPHLIEQKDILGDLHLHSDFNFPSSHDIGQSPIADFIKEAHQLGYQYLGFADHNPKLTELTFRQKQQIISNRKDYILEQYERTINILNPRTLNILIGMEIDIRRDGSLSLEPELIDELDYAIVSIHSSFDLEEAENTKRLLKAISFHPKVKILGHPTGRLLNRRQAVKADWLQVFEFCAKNNKFLEINASPVRLDLPDDLAKEAIKSGAKLIINSDSHQADQLQFMPYGVWTARRAWAEKKDIINTLDIKNLHQVIK